MSTVPPRAADDVQAGLVRALLGSSSDAIIAADREGVIRFWNPGAERIFGHPSDEAVGSTLDLIIPLRLRAAHWRGFSTVMRTGHSRYDAGALLSVPGVRRDGQRVSLEFTIQPLLGLEGHLFGLSAVLRDVTTRFEELKALRRQAGGADHHPTPPQAARPRPDEPRGN